MKCLKLEIVTMDDTKMWYALMDRCKQLTNFVWQRWLVWHFQRGSAAAIRAYLDALAQWRLADKSSRGDKPKLTVNAITSELSNEMYHACRTEFPDLNCRTLVLLLNIIAGRIKNRKAAKGVLSGWMAILLGHESLPSSTRPVPIPFDKQNSKVWRSGKDIKVEVRCERDETTGKSTRSEFALVTEGKVARYAEPIHQVAAGVAQLKGCSIKYDSFRRKWFALIAYEPPAVEKAKVNPDKSMIVRAGRLRPWLVRVDGRSFGVGGDGRSVAYHRHRILVSRWGRQENYRWTATSTKGHGRERALAGYFKLTQSWNHFAKTFNQQVAFKLAQIAAEKGCGTIKLFVRAERRFLETAGKVAGRRDSTAWPWYQFEKLLRDVCHPLGIKVEVFNEPGERNMNRGAGMKSVR